MLRDVDTIVRMVLKIIISKNVSYVHFLEITEKKKAIQLFRDYSIEKDNIARLVTH